MFFSYKKAFACLAWFTSNDILKKLASISAIIIFWYKVHLQSSSFCKYIEVLCAPFDYNLQQDVQMPTLLIQLWIEVLFLVLVKYQAPCELVEDIPGIYQVLTSQYIWLQCYLEQNTSVVSFCDIPRSKVIIKNISWGPSSFSSLTNPVCIRVCTLIYWRWFFRTIPYPLTRLKYFNALIKSCWCFLEGFSTSYICILMRKAMFHRVHAAMHKGISTLRLYGKDGSTPCLSGSLKLFLKHHRGFLV